MTDLEEQPHPLFALDQAAIRCPHELFARLRVEEPVRWIPEIGAYAVTRMADVLHVNRHPELFNSSMPTGPKMAQQVLSAIAELVQEDAELQHLLLSRVGPGMSPVLLTADPPLHDRQRKVVNRAFTPRRVRDREPSIARIAGELVERFADRGEVELVREFAVPLPLTVIADALGVPIDRMDDFKRWSDDFVVAIGNHDLTKEQLARMLRSQAEFFEFFEAQIERRRTEPGDDLVSAVVAAGSEDGALSEGEMLGMFAQFLTAGNETTTKLLASGALRLAQDPALAGRLRSDPALVEPFVEEVLRLDAPVQGLFRVAVETTEIGDVTVPAGSSLWLVYASANRDAASFAAADELDLGRPEAGTHVAFGHGAHFCLGAALARAEARIGFQTLLDRVDDIRLAVDDDDLVFEPSYVLHGLARLPLAFTAR